VLHKKHPDPKSIYKYQSKSGRLHEGNNGVNPFVLVTRYPIDGESVFTAVRCRLIKRTVRLRDWRSRNCNSPLEVAGTGTTVDACSRYQLVILKKQGGAHHLCQVVGSSAPTLACFSILIPWSMGSASIPSCCCRA